MLVYIFTFSKLDMFGIQIPTVCIMGDKSWIFINAIKGSHVIMHYEALGQLRARVFGKHLTELDTWKVKDLLKFLIYPRVARMEEFPQWMCLKCVAIVV